MSLAVIPLGPADAAEMQALHAPLFDPPWSTDAIGGQLSTPGGAALGIGGPSLDGFVLFRRAADEAEILIIAVRPELQRHGLGRGLLEAALTAAGRAGAATMWLEAAIDNGAALALYEAAGFEVAGRRPKYYQRRQGGPVDALILRRALDPASS